MDSIKTHLILLATLMIVGCSSDSDVVQKTLSNTDWTLETIKESDRSYGLRLEANWRLSLRTEGRVDGDGFCNVGSGRWLSDDITLNIINWSAEDSALCSVSEIPTVVERVMARLLGGETFMQRIDGGRLFLETGDNVQLIFSGRVRRAGEQVVPFETLVRSDGNSRANSFDFTNSQPSAQFVVYRDDASFNADYAALDAAAEAEAAENSLSELSIVDFDSSIVIGAFLPPDGQLTSDVLVRSARVASSGLEIEIAHFGLHVPDEASVFCPANDAPSAAWTLVRIDSVIEPIRFAEMARPYCSGIPAPD